MPQPAAQPSLDELVALVVSHNQGQHFKVSFIKNEAKFDLSIETLPLILIALQIVDKLVEDGHSNLLPVGQILANYLTAGVMEEYLNPKGSMVH